MSALVEAYESKEEFYRNCGRLDQSAFDVILEMERGNRRPDDFTFEEVTAAVVAPYRGYDSILSMKFSAHFEKDRRDALDRREITLEMCEQVKAEPLEWNRDEQPRDRTAYWGYVAEKGRYLKVVVEADGEEITTAHWDRAFRRRMERLEGDEQ